MHPLNQNSFNHILNSPDFFQSVLKEGSSNPFVSVSVLGHNRREIIKSNKTPTIKKTLDPEWENQSFYFPLLGDAEMIHFECFNDEILKKTYIGEITIPIQSMSDYKLVNWFKLRSKNSHLPVKGELYVSIEILNCGEEQISFRVTKRDYKKITSDLEKKVKQI